MYRWMITDGNDMTLVREYVDNKSEQAFRELVERNIGLVHSAALRQVGGDAHAAQEITQSVFILLARKAGSLGENTILTAWLYRATRYAAADALRAQRRRREHEQEACMQSSLLAPTESETAWTQISPMLEEAMASLSESDRTVLLLRYFENKTATEIAPVLNLTEAATHKRLTRALDKLRKFFALRHVTLSSALVASVLSAHAIKAAPIGLATQVSAAALVSGTALTTSIVMTTIQKTFLTGVIVASVAGGAFEFRQAANARAQVKSLQLEQTALAETNQQLQSERDALKRQVASLSEQIANLNSNNAKVLKAIEQAGKLVVVQRQGTNLIGPYGLTPEQSPPIESSSVSDTAQAYARFVKHWVAGQLTPSEELQLSKAWPYVEKRYSEPDSFGFFQSEYLNTALDLKDDNLKWQIRQIIESARDEEHAHGLRWARYSDEENRHFPSVMEQLPEIQQKWDDLNNKTVQKIADKLTDSQRQEFLANFSKVMDFDPRLKSFVGSPADSPKFQNLTPQDIEDAFNGDRKVTRGIPMKYVP